MAKLCVGNPGRLDEVDEPLDDKDMPTTSGSDVGSCLSHGVEEPSSVVTVVD